MPQPRRVKWPLRSRRTLRHAAAWLACAAALTHAHAADVIKGGELYRNHCAGCHGSNGRPMMPGAPDLSNPQALMKPDPALLGAIRAGKGAMPAYQGQLRDREILDIVAHLRTFR